MKVLVRHLFLLVLIWELGLGLAKQILYAQEIDISTLAAGMKYYDSFVRSGTGTCIYESSPPAQERRLVANFAFEDRKMRADILEGLEAGNLMVFNGEFQITFTPRLKRYTKQDRSTIDPFLDPRYWMHGADLSYLEKSLGEYLEESPAKILRQEPVDEIPCYVIDVSVHDDIRYLWIAPKMGFRLLKIYGESWSAVDGKRLRYNYHLSYTEHKTNGKTFWFPKMVKYEAIDPTASEGKEKYIFKNTFWIEDFKVNVPVSSLFDPKNSSRHPNSRLFK